MKRFVSMMLVVLLFLPFCAGQAESDEGEAVFSGLLSHAAIPDTEPADAAEEDAVMAGFVPFSIESAEIDGIDPDPAEASADPDYVDPFKVIRSDDRYSVNVREYPYCAIAYIRATGKCGCSWTGSGFLVGPRGVMTAGHCLHCGEHNSELKSMTLYFGYKSDKNYAYRYTKGSDYWYNDSDNQSTEEYDYGFIKLKERVGDKVGWFGLSAETDSRLEGMLYYAAGYRHGELKGDKDFVHVDNPYRVSHTIDTEPGYSGCPIYNTDYYVVAINVAHSEQQEKNYGCRITNWLIKCMRSCGIFD